MPIIALPKLFHVESGNSRLIQSQVEALSKQVPLLYFIALVNTIAVAWTHYGVAPDILTIGFPCLIAIVCLVRGGAWLRARERAISDEQASRRLRGTVVSSAIFGLAFLLWGLTLYQYGDAYAQGHVIFYMAITVISCIFCLMTFRPAALALGGVTILPFAIFFVATGRPVFIAIALNMLIVSIAMVYILFTYSRDFARMIDIQRRLVEKHENEIAYTRRSAEARLAAQRQLLNHAERFKAALNNMLHGLSMFDANDCLIVCNERYAQMYALPGALTQPGAKWRDIVTHRMATFNGGVAYDDVLAKRISVDLKTRETTTTRDLGDGRTILIRHSPIKEGGWVAIHEDITERTKAEERLSHMARHDALTGLANRALLEERLEQAAAGLRHREQFAVLCLDLDHFKAANDALGQGVGDALLREVAARLRSCVLDADTVARIGGDEFAIVRVGAAEADALSAFAQRLLDVLTLPYEIEGHQIVISASAGIARAPRDESSGAALLRLANIALYRAKSEGRRTYRFFEKEMDCDIQSQRRLEMDLRQALVDGAFEAFFQPINDARTKSIESFETLVRWRHPERGMVSPAEFIPLAEETGLIVPLGEWVLRTACKEAAGWPSDVRVSVNLSPRQFKAGDLVATIKSALADAGLAGRRLELEITESVLLDGSSDNLAILHAIRALGVRIALDDFGTGYSSLSYLRSFPFDKLKIDQSFVRNVDERDAREIVKAIAGLGLTLGMTTTAEGVETEGQLALMIEYGCVEVQGFLFSRPVPAAQIEGLLTKFQRAPPTAAAAAQHHFERLEFAGVGFDK
jgi:diguanylate cyclase (GGDEF)-like protein